MCGGVNELQDGVTSGVCQYCGSLTTFPKISDEQTEHLYSRAEHFRQKNDFDKAVSTYESILNRNSEDPEAYWGLVLSRYGIEYVEDPATHERIPTCHRVQYESILADADYQNALKFASGSDRDIYEREANRIAEIQKDILRISAQEKPYDVFICYKETTDGGTRTKDSTLAQDIYYQLTNQGLKVFFSRITLEDKLGQQYEPYIFAALNSAKVMLVIGSKREYFDAVWVKNEWSRFLALMKKDRSKLLIPCYRDMDAYDIPEELSMFQSQDMSKIGFIQDILRGIMKVVNAGKPETKPAQTASSGGNVEVAKIQKRIEVLLEQQEWERARAYCEKILESEPENPDLYLKICMATRKIQNEDALPQCNQNLTVDKNYQMALKFSPPERRKQLELIQQKALCGFYLKNCMESNGISQESELPKCNNPLSENADFQKAIQVALPERRKELEAIPGKQYEYYLQNCMKANYASTKEELVDCGTPLSKDNNFISALRCASPEYRKQLLNIQQAQSDRFLQKCLKANHISTASELVKSPLPLSEDLYFCLARDSALPEQKEKLEQIIEEWKRRANAHYQKTMLIVAVVLGIIAVIVWGLGMMR